MADGVGCAMRRRRARRVDRRALLPARRATSVSSRQGMLSSPHDEQAGALISFHLRLAHFFQHALRERRRARPSGLADASFARHFDGAARQQLLIYAGFASSLLHIIAYIILCAKAQNSYE